MKRTKSKGKALNIRLVGWQVPVGAAVAAAGLVSATALAALMSGAYQPGPGERVAVLICGGNIAPDPFL